MAIDPAQLDVVAFDYGNTLVPFGAEESASVTQCLFDNLVRLFGPTDIHHVGLLLSKAHKAPYKGAAPSFKEHDYEVLLGEIVTTLYRHAPDVVRLEQLRFALYSHFVNLISVEAHVRELLAKLKQRYKLALLSNYPDAHAIRDSLRVHHLRDFFDHIAVSGEIGYVKPHPVTFTQLLAPFKTPSHRVVYVGDHWHCDIQGAKRVGMNAIHTTQYVPMEAQTKSDDDHDPDHTIAHLGELEGLLM